MGLRGRGRSSVLNWFIAVAVDAVETVARDDGEDETQASRRTILREVTALRSENAAIRTDIAELHAALRRQRGT